MPGPLAPSRGRTQRHPWSRRPPPPGRRRSAPARADRFLRTEQRSPLRGRVAGGFLRVRLGTSPQARPLLGPRRTKQSAILVAVYQKLAQDQMPARSFGTFGLRTLALSTAASCPPGYEAAIPPQQEAGAGAVQRIGVIGGGTMGAGIAEVSARAGCDVVVVEADPAGVERFRARLQKSLQRAAGSSRISQAAAGAAFARVDVTTELEATAHSHLVIEATPEVES